MTQLSILDLNGPSAASNPATPVQIASPAQSVPQISQTKIVFSRESFASSFDELADREFDAALQLLAERAKFITGASSTAIALLDEEQMVYRASAGVAPFEPGFALRAISALSAETLRSRKILTCGDTQSDLRLDQESCQLLSMISVMTVPVLRDGKSAGVLELISDRPQAFDDHDALAMQRIAELINTAADNAQTMKLVTERLPVEASTPPTPEVPANKAYQNNEQELPRNSGVRNCSSCGFPISNRRSVCVDCESRGKNVLPGNTSPVFSGLDGQSSGESWLQANIYTIGMVLVPLITVAVLIWLR